MYWSRKLFEDTSGAEWFRTYILAILLGFYLLDEVVGMIRGL